MHERHLSAAQPVRRPAHSAGRRRASERHDPLRPRPAHVGARRQLQGARRRQPLRRGRQLLPVERRGESGADDHGQRAARRRPPARAARRARRRGARRWRNDAVRSVSRFALRSALLVAASCASALAPSACAAPTSPLPVTRVDAVGITVSDMDRAVAFYTRVLPFAKVSDREVSGRRTSC